MKNNYGKISSPNIKMYIFILPTFKSMANKCEVLFYQFKFIACVVSFNLI